MKNPSPHLPLFFLALFAFSLSACGAGSPPSSNPSPENLPSATRPTPPPSPSSVPLQDRTAVILTATPPPATPTAPPSGKVILGFYTGSPESLASVKAEIAHLTIVSADVFTLQPGGGISGGDDLNVREFDQQHGVRTFAAVNNYNNDPEKPGFDPDLAREALFDHPEELIDTLCSLAQDDGYDGINIDFENIASSADIEEDRRAFSSFIHQLATQLHENGLQLIVSVPAKREDSSANTWSYPFDLTSIGQDADFIQSMTYDENGPWGAPGPVAGLDWVEGTLQYAVTQVDPAKLLIGLPAYGYDWDLTASNPANASSQAVSFPWTKIAAFNEKPGAQFHWDDLTQSPSVSYTENGHQHQAWYENDQSLKAKAALVSTYHLGGISVWSLGQEDESFWQALGE